MILQSNAENIRYRCCGCCPIHVMTAGRILAVFLLVCTVINIAYAAAFRLWFQLAFVLILSTPINLAFAYGVAVGRRYFILPFEIFQALSLFISIILTIIYLFASIFAYDKVKQYLVDQIKQAPNYDPKYQIDDDGFYIMMTVIVGLALVFGIVLALWFLHIGWRCYVFLRNREAETMDSSAEPVHIYNNSNMEKTPLP